MVTDRTLSASLIVPATHGFVSGDDRSFETSSGAYLAAARRPTRDLPSDRLARLLKDDELILHCQEVVRLSAGNDSPMLLDVSIRLRSEEAGQSPPGLFLAMLEGDKLMAALDQRVIERALDWCRTARPGRDVIMNFSPSLGSVFAPDFAEFIEGALRARDLDAGVLCLEISEDVASFLPPSVRPSIERLNRLGCNFAVGSSTCTSVSRTAMRALRAKFMRIAGSIVQDLRNSSATLLRVEAANQLCRRAGVHTVAERVEHSLVLRHLEEIGVSYVQGLNIEDNRPLAFYG